MTEHASSHRRADAKAATVALVLLTGLNLVNYIDRYVLNGVQELVKAEFHVSDERLGSLVTYFFITYVIAAPATGWLGDHFPRKPLIVIGALFWSTVNLFSALVHSFDALLVRHAALGIGEASFGIFGPALLSDFYPPEQRNRALTIFNIAIPVGAAIGYAAGGWLGQVHGWRSAFYVSAIPGLLLALAILFLMREPKRGGLDEGETAQAKRGAARMDNYLGLLKNPAYLFATLGYAMSTFTIGGISAWIPSFLQREAHMSSSSAGFTVGAITAATGLLGTAAGGWIAQRWLPRDHRALYWVSALGPALCIPFALLCFFGPVKTMLPALALAEFTLFLASGPVNAAIVNSVSAQVRATALAGQLFLIHLLGDVPSPRIIGFVSDRSNLRWGLGVTVAALVVSALLQVLGARHAPSESSLSVAAG
ncbi:spinster family MFS transporter [Terriglobus aquaticus]|uniref:Spinster family MFS transporter n=1 Tax=Terriglobus aquaticus TaxID=940139 RepID=A0ABW9KIF5_9BACT|nr:MFS transporter [Terriglobus aquaticus]